MANDDIVLLENMFPSPGLGRGQAFLPFGFLMLQKGKLSFLQAPTAVIMAPRPPSAPRNQLTDTGELLGERPPAQHLEEDD